MFAEEKSEWFGGGSGGGGGGLVVVVGFKINLGLILRAFSPLVVERSLSLLLQVAMHLFVFLSIFLLG